MIFLTSMVNKNKLNFISKVEFIKLHNYIKKQINPKEGEWSYSFDFDNIDIDITEWNNNLISFFITKDKNYIERTRIDLDLNNDSINFFNNSKTTINLFEEVYNKLKLNK